MSNHITEQICLKFKVDKKNTFDSFFSCGNEIVVAEIQKLFVENGIPEGALKDKNIFIGLDLKATPDIQSGQTDTFPTPFSRFNSRVSPGVELHSTIYTNIINQDWVINPPLWQKVSFLGLATLLVVASCGRFSPVRSTLVLVIVATYG